MSFHPIRSESKLDNDDDERDIPGEMLDEGTTTTTPTRTDVYPIPYHHYMRSTTAAAVDSHRVQPPRRSRYVERLHHRGDTTPPVADPSAALPHEATTADNSTVSRYRLRRAVPTSPPSASRDNDRHGLLMEESSTSFMELIRHHQQREFHGDANEDGANGVEHDVAADDEEEEEDYEEEELDDYDEEDEEEEEDDEMDDGSTAVTIRAPTDRRSSVSTPIWGGTGVASTGSSSDMGANDVMDVGISTQTSTVTTTTTSVPPINNDGTDQDELLVGSGSSADGGDTTVAASTNTTSMIVSAVPNLHSLFDKPYLREIGVDDILSFQLSSAKPGNGVEQLYDPSYETYWQSDGICQPHWIQIQLPRRLPVTHVALYLDYQLDESYTPRTVHIETGLTVVQDSSLASGHSTLLGDAPVMELHEPVGWCIFPIYVSPEPFDTNHSEQSSSGLVINETTMIPRAHWVRVSILSMHQNGRDTHVRRVALFCQRTSLTVRMPQQPYIANKFPVNDKEQQVSHTKMPVQENTDDEQTDHEDILLYAQTRSTVRYFDPSMLPQRSIQVDQPSSLFGTIR